MLTSRTQEFFEVVNQVEKQHPHPPARQARPKRGSTGPGAPTDQWTKQAEQVATNLRSFAQFLHSIRRAYLDLGSSSSHHASIPRHIDTSKGLAAWEGVKWLSDKERDEIDFGVKIALRKSVDRVRELEGAEQARIKAEAKQNPNTSLSRMLGLAVPAKNAASASLASHRTLVTLYLNSLLAQVSEHQRNQQEARVQRQLEKTASLGGMGGGGGLGMDSYGRAQGDKAKSAHIAALNGPDKRKSKADGIVPSIYRPQGPSMDEGPAGPLDATLTASQISQFEAEESALLKSTETDLASLKLAESSLLEISALQSQLAMHLTQQAELTDKLWEEAVGVTGKVDEGNQQLKKARERNKESRKWLLIFLMMSSGTLLFLDYYS